MKKSTFDAMLRREGRRFFTVAYRICGNREDAEDAVQEAVARAWRNENEFRGDSEVSTWVYRIVVNESLRRKGRVNRQFVESLAHAAEGLEHTVPDDMRLILDDPAEAATRREVVRAVREACLHFSTFTLSAEQRVVYVLRVSFDFSVREIAEICQVSTGTVKSRLHRARENLKRVFFKNCSWLHSDGTCSCERRFGVAFALQPDILRVSREIAATGRDGDKRDTLTSRFPDIESLYRSVREADFDPGRLRIRSG